MTTVHAGDADEGRITWEPPAYHGLTNSHEVTMATKHWYREDEVRSAPMPSSAIPSYPRAQTPQAAPSCARPPPMPRLNPSANIVGALHRRRRVRQLRLLPRLPLLLLLPLLQLLLLLPLLFLLPLPPVPPLFPRHPGWECYNSTQTEASSGERCRG